MRRVSWLVLLFAASTGWSAEEAAPSALKPANVVDPGHSSHGEAFNEGPRRAAYLMGTTGNVSFAITSKHAQSQAFFNQGLGQLHGFWYFEAERSFRQICALDHSCAMAYWGMALANVNNEKRAKSFLAEAVKLKGAASERERMYIEALDAWYKAETGDEKKKKTRAQNYVNALENILHKFSDDIEAKALLGLALWQNRSDLGLSTYFAIDALLNDVLAVNPLHPCHHYRVHLWDTEKASQAVNSAAQCGQSAPGIAHMWHMSGHTFAKLKRYEDSAWQQEASARTDHAYMMRDGTLPDRIHNFAHNNEWLARNLQHVGRVRDAIALSRNTIELPRHPKYNQFPGSGSAHYGRLRLFETYTEYELWDALIADAHTQYLAPTDDHAEQVKWFRSLGRAYFRKGDVPKGKGQLATLEHRLKRLQQEQDEAVSASVAKAKFEGKDAKAIEAAQTEAKQPTSEKIRVLERAIDELQGYVLLADGKPADAHERLKKATNVDEPYLAEVQRLAGKTDDALKALREYVEAHENEVSPLAHLVQMLWQLDKKDEAKQSFEKLRAISGQLDLDAPPFARLTPIAIELGFGADWRVMQPAKPDVGNRPSLDSLGPLTWQPSPAADWSLPDAEGKLRTLAEYRGRPVVVIFYLGFGCLHCAEQLQAFAPKTKEYADAGVSLIAISTDSLDDLKKSHARYKTDESFPFPLVSDDSFAAFKLYQAFDDFEKVPLHATYLIDGEGRIRWHDIGAEPFKSVDFLLREAKRQLHPNQIDLPTEPTLLDISQPANAMAPRNVFPPTPPPAKPTAPGPMTKETEKPNVAAG